MYYYVKEWSESAGGGASMLRAEYLTQNPPHEVGERRERQSDNHDSGYNCSRVAIATDRDDDLPVYR